MIETEEIKNIEDALRAAGVTENTLSSAEKESLDAQGFVILPGIMDKVWLDELRETFEACLIREHKAKGHQSQQEQGTRHLEDLLDHDPKLERIYTHPKMLAAAYHILQREFSLMGLSGRDPLPGYGQQDLHTDWGPRQPSEPYYGVNSAWMLDDFTTESGATRIVPGSHKSWQSLGKGQGSAQRRVSHPDEIFAEASAGSVLIFSVHLWHSGMENRSKNHRRAIFCSYKGREQRRSQPLCDSMEIEVYMQLSPVAKYLVEG